MEEGITIAEFASLIGKVSDGLLAAFNDDEIVSLQRHLRGMSRDTWLEKRKKYIPVAAEFITLFPEDRKRWRRDEKMSPLALALMKLVAWQMCNQLYCWMTDLAGMPESRELAAQCLPQQLAAEAVLSLVASQRLALLWPFELGSPFQTEGK